MDYKAIIIGAGPAGYTCAIRVAQLGGKVLLIERDLVGGICVNWGCTPSKAMISSAKVAMTARGAAEYGVNTSVSIDFARVAARRDEVITHAREEIAHALANHNVEVMAGSGTMLDHNTVQVAEKTYTAENIVIATGSAPLIPPFLNKEDPSIVNSNKLITIKELPAELTIIGGGIIGMEFATIFANLGTKVRIVELLPRCIALMSESVSSALTKELLEQGVEVLTNHKVIDISQGVLTVEDQTTKEVKKINSPLNLIAIGRKAVFDSEMLDKLQISYNKKGVQINSYLQTNVPNVYAIGDASGESILAHVGIQQGILAAEHMYGLRRPMNYSVIPAVVYTLPEVAVVGKMPPLEDTLTVRYKYPFSANLRANIDGHNKGYAEIWLNKSTRKLVYCEIIGDMAGEIIQSFANIIALDLEPEQVARIIHAHPTYNEIVRNTLELALGKAIEYTA